MRKSRAPKKVKNTITKENGNGIQRRHSNGRGDIIVVYMTSGQHTLWADFKRAMWSGAIPPDLFDEVDERVKMLLKSKQNPILSFSQTDKHTGTHRYTGRLVMHRR